MSKTNPLGLLTFVLVLIAASPAFARNFVFTSPPRETPEQGMARYGPIADYLTQVTGQRFVYQHPKNWLRYMAALKADSYDLVFDGPHFISWRMARFGHTPLVKLPGRLDFVVIVRQDNDHITELSDLAGRPACGHAPPNLATLTLQAQFPNPSRQPYIIETRGFGNIFKHVIAKKCDGGVLPSKVYARLNKGETEGLTRVLFQSRPLPHQGISAGTRVPPALQARLTAALLAPEASAVTAKLRTRFAGGKAFVPATREEYTGLAFLLKDMWGFDLDESVTAGAGR